jgi:prevent-host-death family protein
VPKINVVELRQNLAAYLKEAQSGATVLVTHRGKPIAKIVPAEAKSAAAKAKLAAWRKRTRIGDVESPLEEGWEALREGARAR